MPAFNAGLFIMEAVDSLLNQTFHDFELWIIDDGSNDNTRQLIHNLNDTRISKFYFDENRGRVRTVNDIITKVKTEFFTITDADDTSHPQRLELQIKLLDQRKDLMMCGTSYAAIDKQGFVIRKMNLKADYRLIYNDILVQAQFHGPTTIMRKEVIDYFSPIYRDYFRDNIADSDLAARIVDEYKAVNIRMRLYYYRILKTSQSRRSYSIRFANLYKIIAFLSNERRSTGQDSLMKNEQDNVHCYLKNLSERFVNNPSLLYRNAASYYLYWKITDDAWRNARKAWRVGPLQLKNFLLLIYIAGMICYNSFLKVIKREHYQTDFKTKSLR